jgi:DNA ligase-associated metallophosphoesterase
MKRFKILGYFCVLEQINIHAFGEDLRLLGQKALFWPSVQTLIISDLHLGKSGHFRKSGIALSMGTDLEDLMRIDQLIGLFLPVQVIFLGDLFHSDHNTSWEIFSGWAQQHGGIRFTLIQGNHDKLQAHHYQEAGLTVVDSYQINQVCFTHEPEDQTNGYNICGHIHPGIRLTGKAKQSVRIPCFYLTPRGMIMPAFGGLTGLYLIEPKPGEMVYGVVNSTLVKIR